MPYWIKRTAIACVTRTSLSTKIRTRRRRRVPRRDHTKKVTMESDLSTALEMIAPREIVCKAHSVPAATFLFLISAAALKPEIAFEPERVANAMNTGVGRGRGGGRGGAV